MSFMVIKKGKDVIGDSSGGKYLMSSGIYPVTLKVVSVAINKDNARSLNFNVDYAGTANTLYGLTLDNNDGSENFQSKLFHKLGTIANIEAVSDPEVQTHKVGKDQIERDLLVLTDFDDLEVKVKIQRVYSRYEGAISSKIEIKGFYRGSDGATAEEIESGTEVGVQLGKDMKYAEAITYRDGVTAEEALAFEAARKEARSGNSSPRTPTPSVNSFSNTSVSTGFPG